MVKYIFLDIHLQIFTRYPGGNESRFEIWVWIQKRGMGCRYKFGIYWHKDISRRLYKITSVVSVDGVEDQGLSPGTLQFQEVRQKGGIRKGDLMRREQHDKRISRGYSVLNIKQDVSRKRKESRKGGWGVPNIAGGSGKMQGKNWLLDLRKWRLLVTLTKLVSFRYGMIAYMAWVWSGLGKEEQDKVSLDSSLMNNNREL